jgi:probable F420-dependent oxidoreductase
MGISEFGITYKGEKSPQRMAGLAQLAEDAGFEYCWSYDSHVLWKECYPILTHILDNTEDMKVGPLVTNPEIRDITVTASLFATMNQIAPGRAEMAIGRGDSSLRMLGKEPVPWYDFEELVEKIEDLHAGRAAQHPDTEEDVELVWTDTELFTWVAAYGPKMLEVTGKMADGLVCQICDPFIVGWLIDQMRESAEEHGRDPDEIKVMSCGPVWLSDDIEECREHVRWFPAMVGNHVADLVDKHHKGDQLPDELTDYIEARKGEGAEGGYDYEEHAESDADHLDFLEGQEQIIDRFSIVGTAEDHIEKLKKLGEQGVDQFNIYLISGDAARHVEEYGRKIIPEFLEGKEYADTGVE